MNALNTPTRFLAALVASLALLASTWAAIAAASSDAIYQACRNGAPMSGFSKADLQSALGGVPADLDEYFGCSAQINAAIIDKSVKGLPGGDTGIAGTRRKLKAASIDDLTTPAERRRALAQAERSTSIDPADPRASSVDSAIRTSDGRTLASVAAPNSPTALTLGLIALVILLGAEMARRMKGSPRWNKHQQEPAARDGD
jgi:hypothetical protein